MSISCQRGERRYSKRLVVILSAAMLITPVVLLVAHWMVSLPSASIPAKTNRVEEDPSRSSFRLVQSQVVPAKGTFLVAKESLMDPNFSKSVVLLTNYGEEGVLGIVINRPTEVKLSSAVPGMKGIEKRLDKLYIGGPVARNQLLILFRPDVPSAKTYHVVDDVYFTGDFLALLKIANVEGGEYRVYAGHSGWAPGQLDAEIARGDWLILPADGDTVFDKDLTQVWQKLTNKNQLRSVLRNDPVHSEMIILDQS